MRRTTFTLPEPLRRDYTRYVAGLKGYGPRGKSLWVREALHTLFREDPGLQHVGVGVDRIRKDAVDIVCLDDAAEVLLEKGFRILRAQYARWEGVQGDIIRAAVSYRLERDRFERLSGEQGANAHELR